MTSMTTMASMKTTTMTNSEEDLFRKAVRARRLTDPLGAMGFRTQSHRARRERRVRRFLFAITTLGFAGILGLVMASTPAQSRELTSGVVAAANRPGQTVSVNPGANQQSQGQPSHTRTRGS